MLIQYIAVERQRGRFAGFSMYVSDFNVLSNADIQGSTLCYKDGPDLPSLNFTTACTEMGRYVIYYNERLKEGIYPKGYEVENVFTELCEVIVQGKSKVVYNLISTCKSAVVCFILFLNLKTQVITLDIRQVHVASVQ